VGIGIIDRMIRSESDLQEEFEIYNAKSLGRWDRGAQRRLPVGLVPRTETRRVRGKLPRNGRLAACAPQQKKLGTKTRPKSSSARMPLLYESVNFTTSASP